MANRYFTGTTGGLWTATTNWDNFSLSGVPGIGVNAGVSDDVYANNRTIIINTDINIGSNGNLRNTSVASPAITAGGIFSISGNTNINITGNSIGGATTILTTTGLTDNSIVTFNGNITATTTSTIFSLFIKSGVTFNYNGNTIGAAGGAGINVSSGATLNIPNQLTIGRGDGVAASSSLCISNSGTTYITAATLNNTTNGIDNYGTLYGYNLLLQPPGINVIIHPSIENKINGYLYVTGTTIGSSGSVYYGIDNYGFLNFSGVCAGGGAGNGIRNRSTGTLNFIGDLSGTSNASYWSIYDETTTTTTINLNSIFNSCYSLRSSGMAIINVIPNSIFPTGTSTSTLVGSSDGIINNAGSGIIIVSGRTFSGATSPTSPILNRLFNNTGSGTITIYGDLYVRDISSNWGNFNYVGGLVTNNSTSTSSVINIFGSCYGGVGGVSENGICVSNKKQGTINISGDTISSGDGGVIPSTDLASYAGVAIVNSTDVNGTGGTINITANTITNGNGTNSVGIVTNIGVVNVTCNNFIVKTATTAHMFYNATTGRINITASSNGIVTRNVGTIGSGSGSFLYNAGTTTGTINFVGGNLICGYGTNSTIWNNSTGTINVTGTSIIGGFGNTATIHNQGTGIINISGVTLISGGSGTTASYLVNNVSTGSINITGSSSIDLYGSTGTTNHTIYNQSTGTINILNVRNIVTTASTGIAHGINNASTTPSTINVSFSNLIYGNVTSQYGVYNNSTGTINITADTLTPYFYNSTSNHTIYNNSTGRINVNVKNLINTGNYTNHTIFNAGAGRIDISATTISASSLLNTYTINSTTNGIFNITADTISSSNSTPAINSQGATSSVANVTFGNLIFNNGVSPIYNTSPVTSIMISNTSNDSYIIMEDTNNTYETFASTGFTGLNSLMLPISGNVRSNKTYGYSGTSPSYTITGSSIVPPASAVTYGTLFDNTTGTSVISIYDFGNSLTTSGQTV